MNATPRTGATRHEVRGGGGLRLHVREWGRPDGPPIVSPLFPTLNRLAASEAGPHVLPGFARYLLQTWNRERGEKERVRAVEIFRVVPAADGEARRELLGRYDEREERP